MSQSSSSPLRALLIDDSPGSLTTLRNIIQRYTPEVEIVGEAASVDEAIALIKQTSPSLLLLDIEMPRGTGFDLLHRMRDHSFKVIFVTAFDHYAIDAIKFSAIDYLLKPIDYQEFVRAIKRAAKSIESDIDKEKLSLLLDQLFQPQQTPQKIAIPMQYGLQFIRVDQIVYLQSDGNYTWVYLREENKILSSKKIREFQLLLEKHGFLRCHRSYMINLSYLKAYHREAGGSLILEDGTHVQVGRSKKEEVINRLKAMGM